MPPQPSGDGNGAGSTNRNSDRQTRAGSERNTESERGEDIGQREERVHRLGIDGVHDAGGHAAVGGTSHRDLIVVSNRQPYSHEFDDGEVTVDRPTGGVTAGLDPVMRELGGTWIAWGDGDADRAVVDDDGCVTVPPPQDSPGDEASTRGQTDSGMMVSDGRYTLRRVWLSDAEVENYYYGFSNQVLWPLCHSFLGHVNCDEGFWKTYRAVNERFAGNAVESASEDRLDETTIWIHDYHFGLAPRAIRRELGSTVDVAQFWHIPWPAWDTFRACPRRQDLLRGLLGCDRIGFHTDRYAENFLECVATAVDEASVDWADRYVAYHDREIAVRASPMGVPVGDVADTATTAEATAFPPRLRNKHGIDGDTTLAVGVDRLDYSKGIPERLRALESLLDQNPQLRGRLTFVQVGSVSREAIPAYRELREEVLDCVERLNERFGTDDWQPVVYTTAHLSRAELFGLYRDADLCIVSPLRDGMNLVAQEYVAAQGPDPGVLLLSRGTGAYDEFGEHALAVDPCAVPDFATTIEDALAMPDDERRRRMADLRRAVSEQDLDSWVGQCLRPSGERPRVPHRPT
ncbi:alpha,alpha-trehalose-phosphate synthase (UDP-forming) (plasmid) [Halorientalis pallida]|uniref:alpha,alpha-trehalose-phosphate synthase (UDP-forming) n=1 Tax=Halorientalis pallida TaxID=2479928 RepID=UPI003C6F8BE0